eukprot:EG_transcript_41000
MQAEIHSFRTTIFPPWGWTLFCGKMGRRPVPVVLSLIIPEGGCGMSVHHNGQQSVVPNSIYAFATLHACFWCVIFCAFHTLLRLMLLGILGGKKYCTAGQGALGAIGGWKVQKRPRPFAPLSFDALPKLETRRRRSGT